MSSGCLCADEDEPEDAMEQPDDSSGEWQDSRSTSPMDIKQPTFMGEEKARIARSDQLFELDPSQIDANKAEALRTMGIDRCKKGDHAQAGQLLLRSLSMFLAAGGPRHPEVGLTYAELGGEYSAQPQTDVQFSRLPVPAVPQCSASCGSRATRDCDEVATAGHELSGEHWF